MGVAMATVAAGEPDHRVLPSLLEPLMTVQAHPNWVRSASVNFQRGDGLSWHWNGDRWVHEEVVFIAPTLAKAPRDRCQWSGTTTDLSTGEHLAGCRVGIWSGGRLVGVVNINVRLKEMAYFFQRATEHTGGYAFAVDQNGRFLTFPKPALVQAHLGKKGATAAKHFAFAKATELGVPSFRPLAKAIAAFHPTQAQQDRMELPTHQLRLYDGLVLRDDALVSLVHLPATGWQVVVVTPLSTVFAAPDAITRRLVLAGVLFVVLALGAMFWLLNGLISKPLHEMVLRLRTFTETGADPGEQLPERAGDEFGLIAHWFNQRTVRLSEVMNELREANATLELRVRERTAELRAVNQVLQDEVQQRKEAQKKLEELATIDGLTGITNRRHFFELGHREFRRSQRYGNPIAALMLDVDHFKDVNDTHGHGAGDDVLRVLAATLREELREVDLVGRYGGEEFAALLPETGAEGALVAASRVRGAVERMEIPTVAGPLRCTVSIGVASIAPGVTSLEQLLALADTALYEAKNAGRNRVGVNDGGG